MVLLFQLTDDSLEVLLDKGGLDLLRSIINKNWAEPQKKENGLYDLDHEHLSSIEWGGQELTPEFTSENAKEIHSAKIVYLGEEGRNLLDG